MAGETQRNLNAPGGKDEVSPAIITTVHSHAHATVYTAVTVDVTSTPECLLSVFTPTNMGLYITPPPPLPPPVTPNPLSYT